MSTPSKRPIKAVKIHYGQALGYNYDLGKIAFGETPRQERLRIANSMARENYETRIR